MQILRSISPSISLPNEKFLPVPADGLPIGGQYWGDGSAYSFADLVDTAEAGETTIFRARGTASTTLTAPVVNGTAIDFLKEDGTKSKTFVVTSGEAVAFTLATVEGEVVLWEMPNDRGGGGEITHTHAKYADVSPVDRYGPTIAEVNAWATARAAKSTIAFYTSTDSPDDMPLFVYSISAASKAMLLWSGNQPPTNWEMGYRLTPGHDTDISIAINKDTTVGEESDRTELFYPQRLTMTQPGRWGYLTLSAGSYTYEIYCRTDADRLGINFVGGGEARDRVWEFAAGTFEDGQAVPADTGAPYTLEEAREIEAGYYYLRFSITVAGGGELRFGHYGPDAIGVAFPTTYDLGIVEAAYDKSERASDTTSFGQQSIGWAVTGAIAVSSYTQSPLIEVEGGSTATVVVAGGYLDTTSGNWPHLFLSAVDEGGNILPSSIPADYDGNNYDLGETLGGVYIYKGDRAQDVPMMVLSDIAVPDDGKFHIRVNTNRLTTLRDASSFNMLVSAAKRMVLTDTAVLVNRYRVQSNGADITPLVEGYAGQQVTVFVDVPTQDKALQLTQESIDAGHLVLNPGRGGVRPAQLSVRIGNGLTNVTWTEADLVLSPEQLTRVGTFIPPTRIDIADRDIPVEMDLTKADMLFVCYADANTAGRKYTDWYYADKENGEHFFWGYAGNNQHAYVDVVDAKAGIIHIRDSGRNMVLVAVFAYGHADGEYIVPDGFKKLESYTLTLTEGTFADGTTEKQVIEGTAPEVVLSLPDGQRLDPANPPVISSGTISEISYDTGFLRVLLTEDATLTRPLVAVGTLAAEPIEGELLTGASGTQAEVEITLPVSGRYLLTANAFQSSPGFVARLGETVTLLDGTTELYRKESPVFLNNYSGVSNQHGTGGTRTGWYRKSFTATAGVPFTLRVENRTLGINNVYWGSSSCLLEYLITYLGA